MIRVVPDTNVLVSTVFRPGRIPSSVLHPCLHHQEMKLCVSEAILHEYDEVLHRGKFGLDPAFAKGSMERIRSKAISVSPEASRIDLVSDPGDAKFMEYAEAAGAHFLVTGNRKHYRVERYRTARVISPADFMQIFLG